VDLPRPNDVAAAANRNAAGYEQSEGTGSGFTGGVAGPLGGPQHGQRASSLASDAAPNRARRNSVEAPKWAGAFWNPMAEVVKSGQLPNGGTGFFIPKSMQAALAGQATKDTKSP